MSDNTTTSPNVYDDQRLVDTELADFRCESCEGRYPYELLVIQDGHKVCKPNCAWSQTTRERDQIYAEDRQRAAELTADTTEQNAERIGRGNLSSLMDGVSACTRIQSGTITHPDLITLIAGGSSVSLVLTGIQFSSSDVLTASHTGITYGTASISSDRTTWTTTVVASGLVPAGNYTFLFNGSRFPDTFRVR